MIITIFNSISSALEKLGLDSDKIQIDRPKKIGHGDLSCNAPLVYAKIAKRSPMDIAQAMVDNFDLDKGVVSDISIAPPGFINFTFAPDYLRQHLLTILDEAANYGRNDAGKGQRALIEFVSANPTGPLTVGHGRGAILGDTVANILDWNGYEVTREYYYNDAGRQMRVLGQSLQARYLEQLGLPHEFPEDGYEGEYIRDIARDLVADKGDGLKDSDYKPFTDTAEKAIFKTIDSTLADLGVKFDNYFNENNLYTGKAIEAVIDSLRAKGLVYEKDDATWLKGTDLGRNEDKVLIKSTGEPTYRLPDIAYHKNKLERGYDLVVDVFGADHRDTYPDVLAGLEGLGLDTEVIRVLIHQFVTLTKAGEIVKMSTRKATFVTLDDLIKEVGRDVVRFFFLMRGMDTHLNFDLEIAKKHSDDNPVYYLQYAHARMANIQKRAKAFNHKFEPDAAQLDLLNQPEERLLMHLLWWFPQIIQQTLKPLEPQIIANYLYEIATAYHKYYTVAKVVTDDEPLTLARLTLTVACKQVMANGLALLGITAPERM